MLQIACLSKNDSVANTQIRRFHFVLMK